MLFERDLSWGVLAALVGISVIWMALEVRRVLHQGREKSEWISMMPMGGNGVMLREGLW